MNIRAERCWKRRVSGSMVAPDWPTATVKLHHRLLA